jgi:hypothetical protein
MALEFAIDGIEMPKPSDWLVNPKPMASDSERTAGTGKAIVPYLTTAYEVTWTYKFLSAEQYDILYDAYIRKTTQNKSMYHTLTTRDSNSDDIMELEIYTQGDFTAPLYRIKNGVRYYKDVKFVFVSLGGDD